MNIRNIGAVALHLLLVLASLLAAAGHEHVDRSVQDVRLCTIDHDDEHDRYPRSPVPRLDHGAAEHEHECPGCRLGSQRSSLAKPQSAGFPLLVAQAVRIPDASRWALPLPSTQTNRGPPAS